MPPKYRLHPGDLNSRDHWCEFLALMEPFLDRQHTSLWAGLLMLVPLFILPANASQYAGQQAKFMPSGQEVQVLDTPPHQALELRRLRRAVPAVPSEVAEVTQKLWRGSVPDEAGLRWLAKHGFKTIIDMRVLATDKEQLECHKLGMNYVHIPITLIAPSRLAVSRFLAIVDNPKSGKTYIHCFFGTDRAGMMVGIYRQLRQHWTAEQAIAELKHHDFRNWLATFSDTVRGARTKFAHVPDDRSFARSALMI